MNETTPRSQNDVVAAMQSVLDAHPHAELAAVAPDGRFCPMPSEIPVGDHRLLEARAGIELVAPESRAMVLEQFRMIGEQGASVLEVRSASGAPARYALFDTTEAYGVVILVLVVDGEGDDEVSPSLDLTGIGPVRSRFGRIKRTEIGEFLDVDAGTLAMLGYEKDHFASLDTASTVHPDDYSGVVSQWFDLLTLPPGSSRRSQVRYRRGDDVWLWVELTVTNHLDDPDQPHILSEIVDISEQMAAIDQVWHSQELLHRLTQALPLGVLQIDRDLAIVYANDRLPEVTGRPTAATLAEQFTTAVDEGGDELGDCVERVLETGTDADIELRLRIGRSHALRYCQIAVRPLFDRDDSITGAVLCVSDVTDSTRMRKELEVRAAFDNLTQCYNRATVMSEVERRLVEPGPGTAVVFIDLDGFKAINDELGHAAGDDLLRAAADGLRGVVRSADVVGRLGGDEFLVLCPEVGDRELAVEIGERVADALRIDTQVAGQTVGMRASIGVAWTDDATVSAERLVAAADGAMYEAKRMGEGRPVLADGPT